MISADELVDDLSACLKLAPYAIPQSVINRQIDKLRRSHLNPTTSMGETQSLAALVQDKLRFFECDIVEALLGCEIYVVPLPLCVAYSKPKAVTDLIVIGNGLLNLICAMGYWAHFSESLPESLDEHFPLKKHPRTTVRDATPLFLFSLIYRHYCYGEPLPNLSCLVPDDIKEKVRHAVAGAVTFILFHELGHLRLGHHNDNTVRPMSLNLVVEETLSTYQLQELEADEYVLKAIKPQYRPLHSLWINMALNFHIQAEILLSHQSHEHPISVNRLSYANESSEGRLIDPATYSRHLGSMGEKFVDLKEKNKRLLSRDMKPLIDLYSRQEIMHYLDQLDVFLKQDGFGISKALCSESPDWQAILNIQ